VLDSFVFNVPAGVWTPGTNVVAIWARAHNTDHRYLAAEITSTLENYGVPVVTSHPSSQALPAGSQATMSFGANGGSGLTFQWRLNGVNISNGPTGSGSTRSGCTGSTLVLSNITAADAGTYSARITNTCGTATTQGAVLTVLQPPQPCQSDSFEGTALEPAWSAPVLENALGVQWNVGGGAFNATGLTPASPLQCSPPDWSSAAFERTINTSGEFEVNAHVRWATSATAAIRDMQYLWIELLDQNGNSVAHVGYYDGWIGYSGGIDSKVGGTTSLPVAHTLPLAGGAQLTIRRVGSTVRTYWDGQLQASQSLFGQIAKARLRFAYYPYTCSGNTAAYSGLSVDDFSLWLPTTTPTIISQPEPVVNVLCGAGVYVGLGVSGTDLTYRWQREIAPGSSTFIDLFDGQSDLGAVSGSDTCCVSIAPPNLSAEGVRLRAQVASPCGGIVSNSAMVHFVGPSVLDQPYDTMTCPSSSAYLYCRFELYIHASTADRWQVSHQPGGPWTDVIQGGDHAGPGGGIAFSIGAHGDFDILEVTNLAHFVPNWQSSVAYFRRVVTTNCNGDIASDVAAIHVCIADMTGSWGSCDGGVGIEDLLYYLVRFDEGSAEADIDDGTGTGLPDSGVGIEDLLYFLIRFDAGC
jgi:hypothetical protein